MIVVAGLTKTYQKKTPKEGNNFWSKLLPAGQKVEEQIAVDHISFTIKQGEIFGLLGPNGAGKTTTIKMLCTLLEPTSGTATVGGYDVVRQASLVRQHLGAVLTGERSIYWKLTGRENLEYFAALYHIPPAVAKTRITELLARLDLSKRGDELVERYSSGMKLAIPLTYGFDAVRGLLIKTTTLLPIPYEITILLLFMIIMAPAGYLVFRWVERRCQRLGTLGMH